MRKKIIKWAMVAVVVLAVISAIQIMRGRWILPAQVQRVEFRGYDSCDAPSNKNVELTEEEIRYLLTYYSLATYEGTVSGQGCASDFGFVIYLADGTQLSAREACAPRIEVHPPHGKPYWINSEKLAQHAQELIEKYDLTVS